MGDEEKDRNQTIRKAGLTKEQFIGTSNAVSLIVDLTRLGVYFLAAKAVAGDEKGLMEALTDGKTLLIVGIVFAFIGTYFGKMLVQKTTIKGLKRIIGVLLFLMGALMISGIL